MKDIILASKSPRRIELFKKLNLPFSCITPDIDEAMDLSCGLENAVA
ncbi:MAG TPA: septum formation inhibitor Maf, partial [Clostridiaceae bacterium]|nr:septum formation inhibitor Maf [Clostridiaceae bacterium]